MVAEDGRFVGDHQPRSQVFSASIIKSLLLVAYLNRSGIRDRRLRRSVRGRSPTRPVTWFTTTADPGQRLRPGG